MQALTGFTRKYAIMEQLDEGFGEGSKPEAFVRLDSWEGSINASLHVKGLKQGPYRYILYLVFLHGEQLVAVPAGMVGIQAPGAQGDLRIDSDTLKKLNVRPESVRYAAIAAESNDKKWIPLFSSFEKSLKWDESIRQAVYGRPLSEQKPEQKPEQKFEQKPEQKFEQKPEQKFRQKPEQKFEQKPEWKFEQNPEWKFEQRFEQMPEWKYEQMPEQRLEPKSERTEKPAAEKKTEAVNARQSGVKSERNPDVNEKTVDNEAPMRSAAEPKLFKCDYDKLETLIKNNFDPSNPFKGGNRDYTWYNVGDLAKLSNIMFMSGVNVPVFANPKILVGLFRYKHILAGIYKGENNSRYFVIGIPARDETDNRPFENACRWVAVKDSEVRDLGGYWLVYVSLKSGEIVV